jgi:hypothetical protein
MPVYTMIDQMSRIAIDIYMEWWFQLWSPNWLVLPPVQPE